MNLLRTLTTVSGMTLLSRITGLLRETLKATIFGAGLQMDAFEAAFRLPNLLRRLFAEGAFSQAFVPILAEYRRKRGVEATRTLVGNVGTLLAVILIGLSIVGSLAAPWLVYVLAGGFSRTPGKVELTAEMIRIVFPYILFVSLVSLAGGVLNVFRRFAIPAFTPVLLNLSIIGAAIVLARFVDPPIVALAIGVAIGGLAQLVLQIRPLLSIGMLPKPSFAWRDEGVRRILRAMGPAVLGVSAAQISALINTQLAALLGDGRISWITYADRLMEFPTALLGVALGTILLPSLAQHHSDEDHDAYSSLLDWGLRLAILMAVPSAIALAILALPLVSTLYQYGRFGVNDVMQTRAALLGYSVGLPGIVLVKILAPGFYARQMMKTPVKIASLTVVLTQTLAVIFAWPLGLQQAGLTLAMSIGACCNATLLLTLLLRNGFYKPRPGWLAFFMKVCVASAVLALVVSWLAGSDASWLGARALSKIGHLALVIGGGGLAYFATLFALGFRLADFNRREAVAIAEMPPADTTADV
ncbi:MAG TPA: murein biosynthesis integral membrane protein MurJ [Casimicrobiaceae bacterium]|nr:murein biosynthesis integral membrane protein MurJ [Casimicrobiaceae bacterium]